MALAAAERRVWKEKKVTRRDFSPSSRERYRRWMDGYSAAINVRAHAQSDRQSKGKQRNADARRAVAATTTAAASVLLPSLLDGGR